MSMPGGEPQRLLEGDAAMILGGGRGIGAATAVLFGRLGATVVVCARSEVEVNRVADRVRASEGRAISWPLDVRNPDQVATMVDDVLRQIHRIDHVVYCAGSLEEAKFVWEVDLEEARGALEVNVLGPLLLARSVVPVMLDQGSGTLVFVSSALARWALPGLGMYSASRAGEDALVRTLAAEVRGSGVRVELLHPPPTRTRALQAFRAELPGAANTDGGALARHPAQVAADIVRTCLPVSEPESVSGAGHRPLRRSLPQWWHGRW